ncbi:multidrug efflux SMR transporter [Streptomyces sp. NBC_00878]|uniref:DMT family transporter n=1 Tax=Streptomyces sp. NBC_00878 TaxID=2975854 RepID=UPI002250F5CC|nr:multidrug efflux SMR transporter [Streptomyces sp. NBC_00878]MCX4910368.1 multidrug efflux SMR transporter [Streptomyces sp. NBC_00878]
MVWLLLISAITAEVIATSFLKLTEGMTKLVPSVVMAISYIAAFTLLAQALKKMELGIAYAIWSGLGTAAIALIGIMFMEESVTTPKLLGLALIIGGVVMLNLSTEH